MPISRHGSGAVSTLRAVISQIHPVFMLPPIAASWFGSMLAGQFSLLTGALHMTAIFAGVYTAHVKDGYVDFYIRGEDDDHPLTEKGCKLLLASATAVFALCLGGLWIAVGIGAALITLPGWFIGYLHAPQLDMHPISATGGYPLGIALAILGGFYTQTETLAPIALAFAGVFFALLSGVKVIDDAQDYDYDRSISKRTVAVVLGRERARTTAFLLMAFSLLCVLGFAVAEVFPPSSVLAVLAFAVIGVVAHRTGPELATMLLIRGSYVFLALLLAAVWFRPLS
ncbi:UbiA family prenyltransferase [Haladaptatus pallidirubidus]|uniref:1,4-dihydroxy-2-naphthoate octaprenyltransferase n=1 Tax=Haladaptatus pallidirubidus TaxID=1008152 RepID=A0AAV3UC67_9EURY|nr:UbiA family prenyltransferase [Haladaptatus pallidirubidus]